MNDFWKSDVFAVIKAMKATGNQPGIVAQWIDRVTQWTAGSTGRDASAIRAWLPHWQARPFYTAAELAPIFPVLAWMLTDNLPAQMAPERLEFQLIYGGLPVLQNANGTDRFYPPAGGVPTRFFIVEQIHHWRGLFFTQKEFEDVLHG